MVAIYHCIEEMHIWAEALGGRCLSKQYIDDLTPLRWLCAEGHKFFEMPVNIEQGFWCAECDGRDKRQRYNIGVMRRAAESKGGRCVSKRYVNSDTKLKFQCAQGHAWEARPYNILKGTWCPTCAGKAKRTIEDMHKLAKKNKGQCLSKIYKNNQSKLKWECKEGHRWTATPNKIMLGRWCKICRYKTRRQPHRKTIEDMQRLAKQRGGLCISKTCKDNKTKLIWQCSLGHRWKAKPNVIQQGHWCPRCAGKH